MEPSESVILGRVREVREARSLVDSGMVEGIIGVRLSVASMGERETNGIKDYTQTVKLQTPKILYLGHSTQARGLPRPLSLPLITAPAIHDPNPIKFLSYPSSSPVHFRLASLQYLALRADSFPWRFPDPCYLSLTPLVLRLAYDPLYGRVHSARLHHVL